MSNLLLLLILSCYYLLFISFTTHVACATSTSRDVKFYTTKTLEGESGRNIFESVESKLAYMVAPSGICEGLNGEVYISDEERHLIYRIHDENWSTLEVYAGFTTSGFNGDGQLAVGTLLNTPTSIAVNPLNGDLFICDTLNGFIRIVSYSTKIVSSISHTFNKPQGITISNNGFAYISDTGNNLIYKYEISTQILSIYGGGGYLSDGGVEDYEGVDAKLLVLKSPKNLHVISQGKNDLLYFIDQQRLKSIDQNGNNRVVDGNSPQSNLFGIYVSNNGEIYTSSQSNHFIQMKKEKSSSTLLFIGSSSSESGYQGDNQLYDTSVKFYEPSSLIVSKNSILLADKSNNCIRKIDLTTKMVSTLAGGLINHPFGENLSPLKMYNHGPVMFPFHFKNDLYFVQRDILIDTATILRKVSNGKMTTLFGSFTELKYTSNLPQRTFLPIKYLHHFGNGDILISGLSDSISLQGFFLFNVETGNFSFVSNPKGDLPIVTAVIGDSFENSTIYFKSYQGNLVSVYHKSNPIYSLKIDSLPSTILQSIQVIPNFSINGTNSLLFYSNDGCTIYEYIDHKNETFNNGNVRQLPYCIAYTGFSVFDRILYVWSFTRVFEFEWDSLSFKKIVGFDPVIISNVTVDIYGFNGDNIRAESSAIYATAVKRQDSKIYITHMYHVSEISNGMITTIAGLNPLAKTLSPVILMRDSSKKSTYYIDTKVLKKYDETNDQSISLSNSLYSVPPYKLPYLTINIVLLAGKTFGIFSKFDNKIYFYDYCRFLRIDPETMNFEQIIGNNYCGFISIGVKGTMSSCPINALTGFTIDESNGDLIISDTLLKIYRYSISTELITLEFSFNSSNPISSDGIIDSQTNPGTMYSLFNRGGYLYLSTPIAVRRLEKVSNNQFYLRTLVGNSVQGYTGDRLPALTSSLDTPSAIYVKKNGDIVILDGALTNNPTIRMYEKKSGLLIDLAGKRDKNTFNGDGKGSDTTFTSFTRQVDFDESTGEIFFIDGTKYIRKIIPQCDENYIFNAWNNTCDLLLSCNGTLASNLSVCNGNGNCSDFETCQCKQNYEGKYCELSKISREALTSSTILIVSIVVPIVGSLILISIFIIITILVIYLISRNRKKAKPNNKFEIAQVNTENLELSDNDFPSSNSSMIISSNGSISSSSSETENAFSRYSNIIRIGQGAFGSVFKVVDTKQGNKLKAIKVIRFESFTDLNTIMKEASQLSHIKHSNIIKVNDYFITNDNLLIIDMDYYEFGDLTSLLKKQEYVSERIIKQILKQMLSALKYVHEEMHIIHRDIKPTNIFIKSLSKDNIEIVLADFGLAKKFQESKGQSYAGTPLCKFSILQVILTAIIQFNQDMSPEIALGSSYSFNTDIFSLGVSIYQIMTNDTQTSISNLLMGIQSENASNILTKQMQQSEYSNELIQIILKMLEKDANKRMNSTQLLSLNYFQ